MRISDLFKRFKRKNGTGYETQLVNGFKEELTYTMGETQQEADEKMIARLQVAFTAQSIPYLVHFRGYTVIVWFDRGIWAYGLIGEKPYIEYAQRTTPATRVSAVWAARQYIARLAWDGNEETSPILEDSEIRGDYYAKPAQEKFKEWVITTKEQNQFALKGVGYDVYTV